MFYHNFMKFYRVNGHNSRCASFCLLRGWIRNVFDDHIAHTLRNGPQP